MNADEMGNKPQPAVREPTPTKRSKVKDPEYAVFRRCEVPDQTTDTYFLLTQQVKASSRREAIKAATDKLEEGLKGGVFLVIPTAQVQTISRETKAVVVDEWS